MSKIGEHAYSTSGWTGRAGLVKGFDCGPGVLQAARPEAVRLYRKYMGEWAPERNGADVVSEVLAQLAGYRHPELRIELYVGPDQGQIEALCDQVEQAAPACHAAGVGLAAFSFYTGQPEPGVWDYVRGRGWCGLDPARDVICVQEYSNNGLVNNPVNVGRFKALLDAGWTGPIVIGEAGVDTGGQPGSGWQSVMTMDQFYAYLRGYDALLAGYPQVLGATVFNAPGWPSFEFHDPRGVFNYSVSDSVEVEEGTMDEATQAEMIAMEAKQNALLTDLIKQIRTGNWTGAGSVDGIYCALKGGLAAPDYTPSFP